MPLLSLAAEADAVIVAASVHLVFVPADEAHADVISETQTDTWEPLEWLPQNGPPAE